MSTPGHPVSPPPEAAAGGGVRRHHTISASSRSARAANRAPISEETAEDEVVAPEWVGSGGVVGEAKGGLHRQSSLPSGYSRGNYFPAIEQPRRY